MAKHRMALCAKGTRWTFYPPQHTCLKHTEADQEVVAARVQWLGKLLKQQQRNGGVNHEL